LARPAWGYPLARQAFDDALIVVKKLGLVKKANERNRRPTLEELERLMEHFGRVRAQRPSSIPMQKIVAFALFSTRRQEEITLLRWDDLDDDRILVRDMKHPGDKIGNNVYCELPPEALGIVKSMPRAKPEIFPYSTDAISAAFTRACKILGIEDLRFHDLRHEGILSPTHQLPKPFVCSRSIMRRVMPHRRPFRALRLRMLFKTMTCLGNSQMIFIKRKILDRGSPFSASIIR
jgi:integrase